MNSFYHSGLERPGIRCTDDVATRQYAVMRALKTKLRRGVQNGKSDSRYTNLIVQLKDLENINNIHMHYIDWLRSNWSIVRLPTLFSEIFDIPISSKSSTSSAVSESIGDESLVNDFEDSGSEESSGKEVGSVGANNSRISRDLSNRFEYENDVLANNRMSSSSVHLDQNNQHLSNYNHLHHQHQDHQSGEDLFFNLTSFQNTDDKIDAVDLIPTVSCSDVVVNQLTSQ